MRKGYGGNSVLPLYGQNENVHWCYYTDFIPKLVLATYNLFCKHRELVLAGFSWCWLLVSAIQYFAFFEIGAIAISPLKNRQPTTGKPENLKPWSFD
jgi:hypothetical protein